MAVLAHNIHQIGAIIRQKSIKPVKAQCLRAFFIAYAMPISTMLSA